MIQQDRRGSAQQQKSAYQQGPPPAYAPAPAAAAPPKQYSAAPPPLSYSPPRLQKVYSAPPPSPQPAYTVPSTYDYSAPTYEASGESGYSAGSPAYTSPLKENQIVYSPQVQAYQQAAAAPAASYDDSYAISSDDYDRAKMKVFPIKFQQTAPEIVITDNPYGQQPSYGAPPNSAYSPPPPSYSQPPPPSYSQPPPQKFNVVPYSVSTFFIKVIFNFNFFKYICKTEWIRFLRSSCT